MPIALPSSRAEIRRIQSERKRVALERALQSPFWKKRFSKKIDFKRLDDPEVWHQIPILDKDMLRALPDAQFYGEFCHAQHDGIAEYWRSGGVTGQPLFYPRSFRDIEFGLESFARTFDCAGAGRGERAHLSFPLGIHPVGQIYARCAACHALAYDRVGPRHCGLLGRKAGSVPGFDYSPAMKRSGIVWNAKTLDRFLAAPLERVPGTSMTYAGIPDARERADLIAYLASANRSAECKASRR